MGNKTLKCKFKNLYLRFQKNLSNETLKILNELSTFESKELYSYQEKLFEMLMEKSIKIIKVCEDTFPIEDLIEIEYDNIGINYNQALVLLQDDIEKVIKNEDLKISDITDKEYNNVTCTKFFVLNQYKSAISEIVEELKITGEVIDFFMKVKNY